MTVKDLKKILEHAPDDAVVHRFASNRDGDPIEVSVDYVQITFSADGPEILLT